ncbi:MAG TPA: hypothetical protein VLJ13_03990 [Brevundimonas sp.]|nr:hypothetical protein [Brevundimonas sp.]
MVDLGVSFTNSSTWRAYKSDFADFRTWCASQQPPAESLPATPATVALYLTALAEVRKPSTIRRRLASISVTHQVAGLREADRRRRRTGQWPCLRTVSGVVAPYISTGRRLARHLNATPLG